MAEHALNAVKMSDVLLLISSSQNAFPKWTSKPYLLLFSIAQTLH